MIRSENRIIGGVCVPISEKLNFHKQIFRTGFFMASIFMGFPFLIYFILWLTLPNSSILTKEAKKRKYVLQTLGVVIGGFAGYLITYAVLLILNEGIYDMYIPFLALMAIPIGAILGFIILRIIAERRTSSSNIQN